MILLIEGINCTGKSSLAAAVSEATGLPILKFNVPPEAAYAHFRDGLIARFKANPHFIIDRCHLSNAAYQGMLGGGVMNASEYLRIDNLLREMGAWLFLMVDEPALIAERLLLRTGRQDQAETLVRHQIGDIQNRFVALFDRSSIEQKGSFTLPQYLTAEGDQTEQFRRLVDQMQDVINEQNRRLRQGETK